MIIVKMILFLAFFLVGAFFLSKANAQYSFYGTNVSINQAGTSNTSMVVEFLEPTRLFRFTIFGKIENFNYSDDLDIPGCAVTTVQTSIINCNFGTGITRLQLYFTTNILVLHALKRAPIMEGISIQTIIIFPNYLALAISIF